MQKQSRKIQVVGAVFIKNGAVFAAMRGASKYTYIANKYEFPGGKIENGESPPEALQRELREELDLDAQIGRHYMTVEHTYPDFDMDAQIGRHYMTVEHTYPDFDIRLQVYLCEMKSDFKLREHVAFKWLAAEELLSDMWAPADAPIVEQLKCDLINNSL